MVKRCRRLVAVLQLLTGTRLDNDQANFFDEVIDNIFNGCVPLTLFSSKNNDKPWINHYFRQLLVKRDIAWRSGDLGLYRKLRV